MIVTIEWMDHWFCVFNRLYFDDGLPKPKLALSRSKSQVGTMACKRVNGFLRKSKLTDFSIRMSTRYDMTEREAHNILLHEMIHYSIAYTGLKDTSPHGKIFRGMMDSFNRKYGWELRTMAPRKGLNLIESSKPKAVKPCLVLIMKVNGVLDATSVSERYAGLLESSISMIGSITEHYWCRSADPYFIKMPKVRTLRGVKISEERLKELGLYELRESC